MLARTLGRTVAELEETISGEEFALWVAEFSLQPWGEFPADVRSAMVAATMGNGDVEAYMPKWDRDPEGEQKAKALLFRIWCEAHNRREAAKQNKT